MFKFFRNLRLTVEMIYETVIEDYVETQSLLLQLNEKIDQLMNPVERLLANLDPINESVSVTAIGEGVIKIGLETEATHSHIGQLEAQMADLQSQLNNVDIVIPQALFDTVAKIKAGVEGTIKTVQEVDALVPDVPEPATEEEPTE